MGSADDVQGSRPMLRDQVDTLLETFEQQRRDLDAARVKLSAARVKATSSDNLVEVVCGANGVPIEVNLVSEAFKRSTPEKLGRSIIEATQAAAAAAGQLTKELFAPIVTAADDIPDLPDLIPGAPSIRGLFDAPSEPEPTATQKNWSPVEEDEYYRERSYLKER
ncbi:YbaB/EbfC family DNA-binding protein [Nocardia panacis]|uniref:YbaB/EbfC family DNA-binding protein n=1 Tax=Nocardia panacis TaxID=2340916 RepID=A0A3A4K3Z1_9NOCA|nr:YbaB/EbfC family nucleoid-associated protein [Nocardia panacis]RJO71463.1 YbaB/EbfC family DNA-binding protein [Nocardia panacis]